MGAARLHDLATSLSAVAGHSGAWCVVNGRIDVAITAGAHAVQLGYGALSVPLARSLLAGRAWVGASVHTSDEAHARAAEGADYLIAGTVFRTATHPEREASGLDLVRSCASCGIPVVGIGGIDRANAAAVLRAGAIGVAVVGAVWTSGDPLAAAAGLLDVLTAGRPA
jgi:thiamine-phosphate diphosphorylase